MIFHLRPLLMPPQRKVAAAAATHLFVHNTNVSVKNASSTNRTRWWSPLSSLVSLGTTTTTKNNNNSNSMMTLRENNVDPPSSNIPYDSNYRINPNNINIQREKQQKRQKRMMILLSILGVGLFGAVIYNELTDFILMILEKQNVQLLANTEPVEYLRVLSLRMFQDAWDRDSNLQLQVREMMSVPRDHSIEFKWDKIRDETGSNRVHALPHERVTMRHFVYIKLPCVIRDKHGDWVDEQQLLIGANGFSSATFITKRVNVPTVYSVFLMMPNADWNSYWMKEKVKKEKIWIYRDSPQEFKGPTYRKIAVVDGVAQVEEDETVRVRLRSNLAFSLQEETGN